MNLDLEQLDHSNTPSPSQQFKGMPFDFSKSLMFGYMSNDDTDARNRQGIGDLALIRDKEMNLV